MRVGRGGADRVVRPYKETDSRAGDTGGQSRSTLQTRNDRKRSVGDAVPYGAQFTPLF